MRRDKDVHRIVAALLVGATMSMAASCGTPSTRSPSAAIEIETAGVLKRLAAGNKGSQITDLCMPGNRDHVFVLQRPDEMAEGVFLQVGVGIEEDNKLVFDQRQPALEGDCFPVIALPNESQTCILPGNLFHFGGGGIA